MSQLTIGETLVRSHRNKTVSIEKNQGGGEPSVPYTLEAPEKCCPCTVQHGETRPGNPEAFRSFLPGEKL